LPNARELSSSAVALALGLLAEHEALLDLLALRHIYGPKWLTATAGNRIAERVERLVDAALVMRLDTGFSPEYFVSAQALAQQAGVHPTRVLSDIAAPAQLLPVLAAAGYAVDGLIGPVAAYRAYEHVAPAGRDAKLFGTHKEPGARACSRLFGLTALGPDTHIPVTCHALNLATIDDPTVSADTARLEAGRAAMETCGHRLPTSFADVVALHCGIVGSAGHVLGHADTVNRSRSCERARVRPEDLLRAGTSRWLLLGDLEAGPMTGTALWTPRRLWPGLDAEALLAAKRAGFAPLALAAQHSVMSQFDGSQAQLTYRVEGTTRGGPPLLQALLGRRVHEIPTMTELSDHHLAAAEETALAAGIPCDLDPATTKYLVVSQGLHLSGAASPLKVSALIRVTPHRATLWTTTAELGKPDVCSAAIALVELYVASEEKPALDLEVDRFFDDHSTHRFQSPNYASQTAMRVVTMLSSMAAIAAGRDR
jgi:hypothetical protein